MVNGELFAEIKGILKKADIPDHEFDARCIMEDFTGVSLTEILTHPEKEISADKEKKALKAAKKRASGYPLQYILGEWDFFGLTFKVGEGVLIPRPETEILTETVLDFFKEKSGDISIADLCSGSGCIALSLKKNLSAAEIFAVENSSEAMKYLLENIRENHLSVSVIKGDVFDFESFRENFRAMCGGEKIRRLSCIVSNPPYLTSEEMTNLQKEVTFEPGCALDGGNDGLDFYRIISSVWSEILEDNGLLAFEIGETQGASVRKIMENNGFENVKIQKDFSDNDRVIFGTKRKKE